MPDYAPSSGQAEPPEWLRALVGAELGSAWRSWRKPDTGLTRAHRFLVELADGRRVFAKAAASDETEGWLRTEQVALARAPAGLAPRTLAWLEPPGRRPVLVTEALEGHWPASHQGVDWRQGDLERVFDALERLSQTPGPAELPAAPAEPVRRWGAIAERMAEVYALGIASPAWFKRVAPVMADAEARLDRSGGAFVHGDFRSDNICLVESGPCFVDWSNACRGAPLSDLAAFLPTAHLEGGPAPHDVLPDGGTWAAAQAGDFLARLLEDRIAPAWLRRAFLRLAAIALDWAAASLDLPPRGGADWRTL